MIGGLKRLLSNNIIHTNVNHSHHTWLSYTLAYIITQCPECRNTSFLYTVYSDDVRHTLYRKYICIDLEYMYCFSIHKIILIEEWRNKSHRREITVLPDNSSIRRLYVSITHTHIHTTYIHALSLYTHACIICIHIHPHTIFTHIVWGCYMKNAAHEMCKLVFRFPMFSLLRLFEFCK